MRSGTSSTAFVGALLLSASIAVAGCSLLTSFDAVELGDAAEPEHDAAATADQASDQAIDQPAIDHAVDVAADGGAGAPICVAGRYYCGTKTGGVASDLYRCIADGGGFTQARTCSHACVERDGGDVCACVVGGLYCGSDQVLGSNPNALYTCGANYQPVLKQVCPNGCRINVSSDDTCN